MLIKYIVYAVIAGVGVTMLPIVVDVLDNLVPSWKIGRVANRYLGLLLSAVSNSNGGCGLLGSQPNAPACISLHAHRSSPIVIPESGHDWTCLCWVLFVDYYSTSGILITSCGFVPMTFTLYFAFKCILSAHFNSWISEVP